MLQVLYTSLFSYIFDMFILHLLDQSSLILKLFLKCDYNFSVGRIQTRHIYFLPLQARGRSWQGCWFCSHTFHHQFIDWLKEKVWIGGLVMKCWWIKTVAGIRDSQSGTNSHWVNPWIFSIIPESKRKQFWKKRFGNEGLVIHEICWNMRRLKCN